MKKIIKVFIKEIVPIIVGILIAMYINNWNENRKDKKYINQIFSSISKELTETNEDITYIIPTQKSLIDTLKFYSENSKISFLDIMKKNNGFHIPSIKLNSWRAISNSKIELLNYDKVSILANIEEEKTVLKMKSDRLATLIYSNIKKSGKEEKETMIILLMDLIQTETSIQNEIERITNYDQNLKTNGAEKQN